MISDIITKLEAEAGADAKQKAYCDNEMADSAAKKKEKTGTIEKLSLKIDQMTARSAQLKSSTATLQKELADLSATQKEMDKLRKEENTLFNDQKKELTAGIAGVNIALKTLREYYAQDKDHEAKDGAASSIIGLLEVVLSDFTKSLAEITAAENSAQSEYEATTQANQVEKTAKDQAVKYQTKKAAALDKAVTETTADRSSTQAELDAALEYLTKLEDMCVAKPETYGERSERLAAEISGLKQALTILEGEAMLIQRKAPRGGE